MPKVEKRAYLLGADETSTLERNGIPLNPDEAVNAFEAASQETKAQLERRGLFDHNGSPTWTMKTSYYWQQRFPAGQETSVEHRYKPAVGGTVASAIGTSRWAEVRSSYEKYCLDRSVMRLVESATTGRSDESPFNETWISYILTTGANWAAPIRNFHLVVDKGHSDNLVSFCADRVRQITPTEFEFTATNFVPNKDLDVLILARRNPTGDNAKEVRA